MPHCLSTANCLTLVGRLRRHPRIRESRNESVDVSSSQRASFSNREFQSQLQSKPPSTTIHDLDDDSLLYIFYLFRPRMFKEDVGIIRWSWAPQRWWYKLVQVCRRWRCLFLGSASHLRLCLVCTPGTPVENMLAHSPPFPLVIGYSRPNDELTAEDEEGIMLALRHRDRVRFIFIDVTVPSLKKLLPALDNRFPVLEYLRITPPAKHNTHLALPPTFQAPRLRNLWSSHFASPIGSPLFSTATGLVTLTLDWIHPSTYPHPNDFLGLLSLLPHLERIFLSFDSSASIRDIESQMSQAPITIYVIHPNLRLFAFVGDSDFLEAILPHIAMPLLEAFTAQFFYQLHFSVPHLAKFMMNTGRVWSNLVFTFHREAVVLNLHANEGAKLSIFEITVSCRHLDLQVSSATQITNVLRLLFSNVVDLTLDYREHTLSSGQHNQPDHTQWRELLGSSRKVKMLRVHNGLIREVSRSLQLDGESPLEILPELKELICPTRCIDDKTFAPFIREREVAGQPVNLIGEKFPAGRFRYRFYAPTGITYIEAD